MKSGILFVTCNRYSSFTSAIHESLNPAVGAVTGIAVGASDASAAATANVAAAGFAGFQPSSSSNLHHPPTIIDRVTERVTDGLRIGCGRVTDGLRIGCGTGYVRVAGRFACLMVVQRK